MMKVWSSFRLLTACVPLLVSPALALQVPDTTTAARDTMAPQPPDFEIIEDRWRIKAPPHELAVEGSTLDPYNQNVLKGDFPIIGQNTFLILTATAENIFETVTNPTPIGVSTREPLSDPFFGNNDRLLNTSFAKISFELYGGQTAYRPRDWELKATAVFNLNYTKLKEFNGVNINVRKGDTRTEHHLAFQELFVEKHLFDVSDRYDFVSLKVGIQKFASDFRGFVFSDFNLGARLFGSLNSNRIQWNLIYLPMLEKETNSELNTVFDRRDQDVAIANVYLQDWWALGYTTQFSFHYNHDKPSVHYDENGFPVRPAIAGNSKPHEIKAYYVGWAGDGHIDWLNITHAVYYVFGTDDFNSFAGRKISIGAYMAALELSVDDDWQRFKVSGLYASGDDNIADDKGKGFDAILDSPVFAGGAFGYWNSQRIGIQNVGLVQKFSFLPTLRSSKLEGQANFVNPGLILLNAGYDAELTPKLKLMLNANYLRFVNTAVLVDFLNQNKIHKQIGVEASLGLLYRPLLNNNAILTVGVSMFSPLDGFKDIYEDGKMLYAGSVGVVLTY
ncbi:MAG TPA: hypothetical protein VNL69_09880 [Bacteroidota bacterium]|nr:hypothetical protein [Bacteroidota bacterium]